MHYLPYNLHSRFFTVIFFHEIWCWPSNDILDLNDEIWCWYFNPLPVERSGLFWRPCKLKVGNFSSVDLGCLSWELVAKHHFIEKHSVNDLSCQFNNIYIYIIHFCAFLFTKISYIFQSRIYNKIPDRTSNVILESVVAYLPNGTFYSICNIPQSITMDSVLFGYIYCDGELTNFEQTRFVCLPIVCNTFQPTLIISLW